MLSLSYGQIEALVTGMLDVDPTRTSAITARFNTVRRMQFPEGVNTGATGRFKYDLDATMKCMLLFALIDALVMPQQAVGLLREGWLEIAPALRWAIGHLVFDGNELTDAPRPAAAPYLVLAPAALDQLRNPDGVGKGQERRTQYRPDRPGKLRLLGSDQVAARLAARDRAQIKPATLVVDLFDIVSWTARATVRAGWVTPQALGARSVPKP